MKVTVQTSEAIFDSASSAFYEAAAETRDIAIANAAAAASHNPKTGSLSKTIKMWRRKRKDRPTATIGSRTSPYVTVMERGGWSRGRGPHVQRNRAPRFIGRALPAFGPEYTRRLQSARGVSYMDLGRRSTGPVEGVLTSR